MTTADQDKKTELVVMMNTLQRQVSVAGQHNRLCWHVMTIQSLGIFYRVEKLNV